MFAIFEDGARQYQVSEGQVVKVDFRAQPGERTEEDRPVGVPAGTSVEFAHVLLYRNGNDLQIGRPLLAGARVVGEVVDHPSTKVYVQKFRRRKNYRRLRGHRQRYTAVRIKHILLAGQDPSTRTAAAPAAAPEASAPPAPTAQAPAPPPAPEPTPPAPPATGETPPTA